ncbi:unnamed protein product [Chrysoparadoxa australica]
MVNFGKEIANVQSSRSEYAPYYLDYPALKDELKDLKLEYEQAARTAATPILEDGGDSTLPIVEVQQAEEDPSVTTYLLANSNKDGRRPKSLSRRSSSFGWGKAVTSGLRVKERRFAMLLDAQVEKVVLFFLSRQGAIAADLQALTSSRLDVHHDTEELRERYRSIGYEVCSLLEFLQLNVTALRKILKKHDKQIRSRLMAENYLSSRQRSKYAMLHQLYDNRGVLALIGTLSKAFKELEVQSKGRVSSEQSMTSTMAQLIEDREVDDVYSSVLVEGTRENQEPVLSEIARAQESLSAAQARTVQDYLTSHSDLALDAVALEDMTEKEVAEVKARKLDKWSAYLNLATTFLYMTNYYIVGPTSTEYAAVLGSDPAMSGVIIGMAPIAACISCAVYSIWTNYNFKQPLLLCTAMLVVGNLLYALALNFQALWMVLVGRLLVGLGGARGVNRRYIADTVPLGDRTFFSAAFVAVGAVGMAFGPFLAAVINLLGMYFKLGFLWFNGMTGPGWFMTLAHAIFGILLVLKFKEPPRKPAAEAVVAVKKSQSPYDSQKVPSGTDAKKRSGSASEEDEDDDEEPGPWIPLPLVFCLGAYFANKLLCELAVSASPVLSLYLFKWSVSRVGTLMAVLGLITLPVSILVGKLSFMFEDRAMMLFLGLCGALGCLIIINYSGDTGYTQLQYVAGTAVIFVGLQAHEGVVMSMTSKLIPAHLARGTFNSGFLATEASTGARVVGDLAITFFGVGATTGLLNMLFIPGFGLLMLMSAGNLAFYALLDA